MICNGTTLRFMSFQVFIITAHVRRIFLENRISSGGHHSKKIWNLWLDKAVGTNIIFYEIIVKITTSSTGSTAVVSCPASWGYSRLFFRACFQRPKMTKARLCKVWWCTKHIVAKNLSRDCYCKSVSGLLSK